MLGARLGVHAFARSPGATVAEQVGAGVMLDPCPRQLHPPGLRRLGQHRTQPVDVVGVGPHHGVGLAWVGNHFAARFRHDVGHPRRHARGPDDNARCSHDFERTGGPASLVRFPMANIKSQIKRNLQNEKRRVRNKAIRSELRTRAKTAVAAAETGAETTAEAVREAVKRIDKAAAKGAIHKNQASNRKARLMKRVAKLSAKP